MSSKVQLQTKLKTLKLEHLKLETADLPHKISYLFANLSLLLTVLHLLYVSGLLFGRTQLCLQSVHLDTGREHDLTKLGNLR